MNVDLRFGGNDFTYRKLFHLLIGNCFITCHLLIETTVGCVPKFVSIGYFCGHLVTFDLLIELYPMVPFSSVVRQKGSVPPLPMYVLTTPTVLSATHPYSARLPPGAGPPLRCCGPNYPGGQDGKYGGGATVQSTAFIGQIFVYGYARSAPCGCRVCQ